MLGTCTAAVEVCARKQRTLFARQDLGCSHKCLFAQEGQRSFFLPPFFSRQYRCKHRHVCVQGSASVWLVWKHCNRCFKASQSEHLLLCPFCFRSLCKNDKHQGSEIEKLEEDTGNRKMSPPQYITFPRLKWSAVVGSCCSKVVCLSCLEWLALSL